MNTISALLTPVVVIALLIALVKVFVSTSKELFGMVKKDVEVTEGYELISDEEYVNLLKEGKITTNIIVE
jgi:hypothetical protein